MQKSSSSLQMEKGRKITFREDLSLSFQQYQFACEKSSYNVI